MNETPKAPTLDGTLALALALLAEGAEDAGSAWRTVTLGTLAADGAPALRSVILRRADPPRRLLEIHTDARSRKMAELRACPRAALHGWDAARRIQLRLSGRVACHSQDAVSRAAWDRLSPARRGQYRISPGPGTRIAAQEAVAETDEAAAFGEFVVLRFTFHTLEWLHLQHGSHARARFGWENGAWTSMWLVP